MAEQLRLPWVPDSRQQEGRTSEQNVARRLGARAHPNSGAGRIKRDASDETTLYEMKLAGKTHRINADDLAKLYSEAAQQGKEPVYHVTFNNGIEIRCQVTRTRITTT